MSSTTKIDKAFEEFEASVAEGKSVRKKMISLLEQQISKCAINDGDKALLITAKMSVLKTLDDLIKSDSESSVKRLKMELARKDSETNGAVGATIVNLIKSIRATGEMFPEDQGEVDRAAALKDLKDKQDENPNLKISDGELEACGSMPTTDGEEPPTLPEKKEDDEDEE